MSSARTDLCGGRPAMAVPTATLEGQRCLSGQQTPVITEVDESIQRSDHRWALPRGTLVGDAVHADNRHNIHNNTDGVWMMA